MKETGRLMAGLIAFSLLSFVFVNISPAPPLPPAPPSVPAGNIAPGLAAGFIALYGFYKATRKK